jgi:predicted transposase/invertase (TIGR01784 family)
VKAECLRLLVTLKLDPAKSRLISKFVDSYLRLDVKEEQMFQAEIDRMGMTQKEGIMQTMTSWEEKGMKKGLEKATQSIAINLLRQGISIDTIAQATGLTLTQLQEIQAKLS